MEKRTRKGKIANCIAKQRKREKCRMVERFSKRNREEKTMKVESKAATAAG